MVIVAFVISSVTDAQPPLSINSDWERFQSWRCQLGTATHVNDVASGCDWKVGRADDLGVRSEVLTQVA